MVMTELDNDSRRLRANRKEATALTFIGMFFLPMDREQSKGEMYTTIDAILPQDSWKLVKT